ncbi:unnamed protein product, partial [Didymodactylos carnosus]
DTSISARLSSQKTKSSSAGSIIPHLLTEYTLSPQSLLKHYNRPTSKEHTSLFHTEPQSPSLSEIQISQSMNDEKISAEPDQQPIQKQKKIIVKLNRRKSSNTYSSQLMNTSAEEQQSTTSANILQPLENDAETQSREQDEQSLAKIISSKTSRTKTTSTLVRRRSSRINSQNVCVNEENTRLEEQCIKPETNYKVETNIDEQQKVQQPISKQKRQLKKPQLVRFQDNIQYCSYNNNHNDDNEQSKTREKLFTNFSQFTTSQDKFFDTHKLISINDCDTPSRIRATMIIDETPDINSNRKMRMTTSNNKQKSIEEKKKNFFENYIFSISTLFDQNSQQYKNIKKITDEYNSFSPTTTLAVKKQILMIVPVLLHPNERQLNIKQNDIEFVTFYWLQDCDKCQTIIDLNSCPFYKPFMLSSDDDDDNRTMLNDCCITISGYLGSHRQAIVNLCKYFGGDYSETLNRYNTPDGKVATTHLITKTADGKKYQHALKWKTVKIISINWLLESILYRKRSSENDHSNFDSNVITEKYNQLAKENNDRLKRYLQQQTENNNRTSQTVDEFVPAKEEKFSPPPITDTQLDKLSELLPPTESQIMVDQLMTDIDYEMEILQKKSSSSSSTVSVSPVYVVPVATNSRHIFNKKISTFNIKKEISIPQTFAQPQLVSPTVTVEWLDDHTLAERRRIKELLKNDEWTQMMENDDDFSDISESEQKIFLISSLSERTKLKTIEVLSNFKSCLVEESNSYKHNYTHLITGTFTKTEKLLAFIAAGKWILHPSYIYECERQNSLVDEENYEWANYIVEHQHQLQQHQQYTKEHELLIKISKQWRLYTNHEIKQTIFSGWKVCFLCNTDHSIPYGLIIIAGGGQVLDLKDIREATYIFNTRSSNSISSTSSLPGSPLTISSDVQIELEKYNIDWKTLEFKSLKYIFDQILKGPPINMATITTPLSLHELTSTSQIRRKRLSIDNTAESDKRLKHE